MSLFDRMVEAYLKQKLLTDIILDITRREIDNGSMVNKNGFSAEDRRAIERIVFSSENGEL